MNVDEMRFQIFGLNIIFLWFIATMFYFLGKDNYLMLELTSISLFIGAILLLIRNYAVYWNTKELNLPLET